MIYAEPLMRIAMSERKAVPALPPFWKTAAKALTGFVVPVLLLVLWYVSARLEWVAPQVLPAPDKVLDTLRDLIETGDLRTNVSISLERVVFGFALGAVSGILAGALIGTSRFAEHSLRPSLLLIGIVPVVGWLPLLMMLLGIGEALKIVVIAKATFLPVAISAANGFRNVPQKYLDIGKVYGFSRWQTLKRITLPASILPIFTGLRNGLMTAWVSLVAVEMLVSTEGVGFLMVWGRQLFQLDLMIAMMLVIGVIGFLMDKALVFTERSLVLRFGGRAK